MKNTLRIFAVTVCAGLLYHCIPLNPYDLLENVNAGMVVKSENGTFSQGMTFSDSTGCRDTIVIDQYIPQFIAYAEVRISYQTDTAMVTETLFRSYENGIRQDSSVAGFLSSDDEYARLTMTRPWTFYKSGEYIMYLHVKRIDSTDLYSDTINVSMYCRPAQLVCLFDDDELRGVMPSDTADSLQAEVGSERDSLRFAPRSDNPYVQVVVNGIPVGGDAYDTVFSLTTGDNRFRVEVFADDPGVADTFMLTVFRRPSSDATLAALDIAGILIDTAGIDADTLYSVTLPQGEFTVVVNAVPAHPQAVVEIGDSLFGRGAVTDTFALENYIDTLTVTVTAEDGQTKHTYRIELIRERDTCTTLAEISARSDLIPVRFKPEVRSYSFTIPNYGAHMRLFMRPQNSLQHLFVAGEAAGVKTEYGIVSGDVDTSDTIPLLSNDTNRIEVLVVSESEDTGRYVFSVFRVPSTVATLDSIVLSEGRLSPEFGIESRKFQALVPSACTTLSIRPVPTNDRAKIIIDDNGLSINNLRGSYTKENITRECGEELTIRVTSEDGNNSIAYVITCINRAFAVTVDTVKGAGLAEPRILEGYRGMPVAVTLQPDEGYVVHGWIIGQDTLPVDSSGLSSVSLMVDSACTVLPLCALKRYPVRYAATVNGSVSGPDTVEHGIPFSVSAHPDRGFRIARWSSMSGFVTFSDTAGQETFCTVTDTGVLIDARFMLRQYHLSVLADEHGKVITMPEGAVLHGELASIGAAAGTGYHFDGWSVSSGYAVVTEPQSSSTTVLMDSSDATVTASFAINRYRLDKNMEHGRIEAPDSANHGEPVTVTAVADFGYEFGRWSSDSEKITIEHPDSSVTAVSLTRGNARITASFELKQYSLVVINSDSGTVSAGGRVLHGELNRLIACPADNYRFITWVPVGGSPQLIDSANDTCYVVLTEGDASVKAVFERLTCSVTIAPAEHGAVGIPGYPEGRNLPKSLAVSVSVTPSPHYHLDHWETDSGIVVTGDSGEPAMITVHRDSGRVRAFFELDTYTLTLAQTGQGTVFGVGAALFGDTIWISANPATGYTFSGWSVTDGDATLDSAEDRGYYVLPGSDATVTAEFLPDSYTLILTQPEHGHIASGGSGVAFHGIPCQVTAYPDDGYRLVNWSNVSGAEFADSTAEATTVTITGPAEISAEFDRIHYTLAVITEGDAGDTVTAGSIPVSGSLTMLHGVPQTLHAHPGVGSRFVAWHPGADVTVIGEPAGDSIAVMLDRGDGSVTAEFELIEYSFFLHVRPDQETPGGTTSPESEMLYTVRYGKPFDFRAVPEPYAGYEVDTCTSPNSDGTRCILERSGENSYSYTVYSDIPDDTVYVSFRKKQYKLTIIQPSIDSGTITLPIGSVTDVIHGKNTAIAAVPAAGFDSLHWTHRRLNTAVTLRNSAQDTVDSVALFEGDDTLTASFRSINHRVRIVVDNPQWGTTSPESVVFVNHFRVGNITAVPTEGFRFTSMTTSSPRINVLPVNTTVTQITAGDTGTVTAHFIRIVDTLTVHRSDSGSLPAADEVHHLDYMDSVGITAQPLPEYDFSHWQTVSGTVYYREGFDNTMAEAEVYCRGENAGLSPVFSLKRYALAVTNNKPESTLVTVPPVIEHGIVYTCSAVVSHPLRFVGWTTSTPENISIADPALETTTFTCTGDAQLHAEFEYCRYPVVLSVSNTDGATLIAPVSEIEYGQEEVIGVAISGGYEFVIWNVLQNGIGLTFTRGQGSPVTRIRYTPQSPAGTLRIEASVRRIQ